MLRRLVLALVCLAGPLGLATPTVAESTPVVRATDARVAGDERRTRLIVDLTGPVTQSSFLLADPYRVVVDLPQVDFVLPASAGHQGRGLISAYRYGLIAPGKSRMVLDLGEPATIDKAFVLDPADGQPARLVIDLIKAGRDQFLAAVAAQQKPTEPPATTGKPAGGEAGLPVVVIDPGHGGIDSGAVSPKGEVEKTI